jgi:hypothetical protein
MPDASEFPSRGKILSIDPGHVIFNPVGTNYQIKLATSGKYAGAVGQSVEVTLGGSARKIWTVASGGNFVAPIFGPPRIIQGRVKWLDQTTMVVHAGPTFHITLPAADSAMDLTNGGIGVGSLVNITLMPGATLKPAMATV